MPAKLANLDRTSYGPLGGHQTSLHALEHILVVRVADDQDGMLARLIYRGRTYLITRAPETR